MAWQAAGIKVSYDFAMVVPESNPVSRDYQKFTQTFGEDGNVMVVGVRSPAVFQLDFFRSWHQLGEDIQQLNGISSVLSVPKSFTINKNAEEKTLDIVPLLDKMPASQSELDSVRSAFLNLPFYENLLHNASSSTTLMAVSFNKEQLDSKERLSIVDTIITLTESFEAEHDVTVHHSGLPYIRTYTVTTITDEITLFMLLAVGILAVLLFVLFRNINAVIFPSIVVAMSAVWSLGLMHLLGFKVTMLTGLLPTLIVVIGIPNCVYLINKYHIEFKKHGNKQKSLMRTIEKTGNAIWFTNLTTGIGFGVFYFTKVEILSEFGLVAFVSIMGLFLISIAMIPVVFSFLPNPKYNHIVHLDNRLLQRVIGWFEVWAIKRRVIVFGGTVVLVAAAVFGLSRLQSKGFILDDVPKQAKVYQDLKFFEHHFGGVLPFEVMVNSGRTRGATDLKFLRKINAAQDSLRQLGVFSRAISVAEAMKFAMQAYKHGDPQRYRLPNSFEMASDPFLRSYLAASEFDMGVNRSFLDDSSQTARISLQVADVGSDSMPRLLAQVRPILDTIFAASDSGPSPVTITGTSIIATEGFNYLISGLVNSVVLAFILIAVIMAYLFRSARMLLIALLPNVIPLLVTAGLMGFLQIPLKPSTVLIFSVAFGISVDYTIHFLAKYRQELYRHNWQITRTVIESLRETGMSMIYTSLILFFGFIVLTISKFDGTANLGRLTSITLIVAMLCNLVLLPALLVTFAKGRDRRAFEIEPIMDFSEEENGEIEQAIPEHEEAT